MTTPASDAPRPAGGELTDRGGRGDVGVLDAEPPSPEAPVDGDHDDQRARWAAIAFGAYVALAAPLLLFVLGRHLWFFHDEWSFFVDRQDDSFGDVFQPHNEHWVTMPILLYKGVFALVGLHSYVPYQVAVVAAHLGAAVLLRVVMRRAGVDPWIATITAGTFVLFGAGERNIVGGFQIAFTGALFFGLVHLLLADHEGRVDWRDGMGVLAGVLALMFSGIGIAMAVVVGVAMWMRRGWRIALLHVVPLAAVYLTWYLIIDPRRPRNQGDRSALYIAGQIASFARRMADSSFDDLGYLPWVGPLLAILLVVGVVLAWLPMTFTQFRRQAALPFALLAGGLFFMVLTGYGRWENGTSAAVASRYSHLIVAFALPALAVAADAVIRRWRVATPVVVVLLLIGVPGNITEFGNDGGRTASYFDDEEQLFVGMARSPLAEQVSPRALPYRSQAPLLTVGWLLDAEADGVMPDIGPIDPAIEGVIEVHLGVSQVDRQVFGTTTCREVVGELQLEPDLGDVYQFRGQIDVFNAAVPTEDQRPVTYDAGRGPGLIIQLPDLELTLAPARGARTFTFCS